MFSHRTTLSNLLKTLEEIKHAGCKEMSVLYCNEEISDD